MNLAEFMHSVPEFAGLSRQELEVLEGSMTVREYADGHAFFTEGSPGSDMYLIVEGQVAVTHAKASEPGEFEIKRMGPGELFGLIALIDRGKRTATCRAVGPVTAASLPRTAFELLYQTNAPLGHHFLQIVARQLMRDFRGITQVIRDVIFHERHAGAESALREIIAEYVGPERRKGERRHGARREDPAQPGSD